MQLSPSIEMLFPTEDLPSRLQHLKDLGYEGFEFTVWWEKKDIDELTEAARRLDLTVVALCTKFISLVDPTQRDAYIEGLKRSIEVAKKMGCTRLISQTGAELPDVPRVQQVQSLVDGLKACAPILEAAGVTLVVEPLNTLVNHKGYFLSRSPEAFEIIRQVNSPNVRILYDVYHQQITEGNLIRNIQENIDLIGHFHIADNPGRQEPGTGEINYKNVLKAIRETGYSDWVGLEYRPSESKGSKGSLEDILALVQSIT
ncbi:MAG: TIM barrel protein [Firmicutes bacterium]|nr:TIM barrel protein [Bacillota bacterium]